MKNILVGIDFKENTQNLIDQAIVLAEKFQSKIWLLHAVAPEPDFVGYGVGPQSIRDFRADELKNENKMLSQYVDEIKEQKIEAEAMFLMGATTDVLLDTAVKLNVDLVVVGHHQHGFMYKIIFGDTAEEVVKKANIPVLIVPC